MTAQEFKEQNPSMAHLEGEKLWNAMEQAQLQKRKARYRLRWLFYRPMRSRWMVKGYENPHRCKICKSDSSLRWIYRGKDLCAVGRRGILKECHAYQPEFNWNWNHLLWLLWKAIDMPLGWLLDKLHILRKPGYTRTGMLSDEDMYYKGSILDMETGEIKHLYHKRKWWEYIVVRY